MAKAHNIAPRAQILIALGGNLPSQAGDPSNTLKRATEALSIGGTELRWVSPFFQTPCFPKEAGPDYVNAVASLSTDLAPPILLNHLHTIEYKFDRERKNRWASRTLDLDLLAYDDLVFPDKATFEAWSNLSLEEQKVRAPKTLILPHPRLHERGFVLVPLARVAPDWRHPVFDRSAADMLADLPHEATEGITEMVGDA